jgi:hypothetical protein
VVSLCGLLFAGDYVTFFGSAVLRFGGVLMEKSFLMESKIFVFSVLDGASRLRVERREKVFPAKSSSVHSARSGLHRRWRFYWVSRKIKSSSNPLGKGRNFFFF